MSDAKRIAMTEEARNRLLDLSKEMAFNHVSDLAWRDRLDTMLNTIEIIPGVPAVREAEAALREFLQSRGAMRSHGPHLDTLRAALRHAPQQDREKVREPVRWFAEQMERVLREHDGGKDGWSQASEDYLFRRLAEEVDELEVASGNEAVIHEAVDVANFAMMLADNARAAIAAGPVDLKPCVDDLCHGGGCMRAGGEPTIERCDICGQLIGDEFDGCRCGEDEEFQEHDPMDEERPQCR